jgi:HAD domain family 1 in Swiss Army Knife RNA repair proteins
MHAIRRLSMSLPAGLGTAMRLESKAGPISALHVFDFDGTLVRTPGKDNGTLALEAATGQVLRGGGWWGREESLGQILLPTPLARSRVIGTVFDELEEISLRSQTAAAIVMTGRLAKLRPAVLRVLDEAAKAHTGEATSFIMHDAVFTHPGRGLTTIEFKTGLIVKMIEEGPESIRHIKNLHIWEDRVEHAELFAGAFSVDLKKNSGIETTVHFVGPETP